MRYFMGNIHLSSFFKVYLIRPTLITLVFLLLITPFIQAYAFDEPMELVEHIVTDSVSLDDSVTEDSEVAPPKSMEESANEVLDFEKKQSGEKNEEDQPQVSSSVITPIRSLTEVGEVNKRRLTTEVDSVTGSMVYRYDIVVPPGRNDMTPNVALVYNSSEANRESVIGSGWEISIPTIQRINKVGVNYLYSETHFVSSMDGELISVGSGNYVAKDETGDFRKYLLTNNVWTVTDKTGTVYKFGTNTTERQDDTADTSKVYKWMLQETRDTNDNYIKYTYYKDAGQIYPSQIIYTGNGSTDGVMEVNFDRTSRSSAPKHFDTGFSVQNNYRITEIRTEVNNVWARKYTLSYTSGDNGGGSYLDTITEAGQDDSSVITTLPNSEFNYTTAATDWTYNASISMPLPFVDGSTDFGMRTADINGDGLLDILCHNDTTSLSACNRANPEIYMNTGSGWTNVNSTWQFPTMVDDSSKKEGFLDSSGNDTGLRAVDLNGDMKVDLVRANGTTHKYVYLNNGSGWTYSSSWTIPHLGFIDGSIDYGFRMGDFTGDGLPDIICHSDKTSGTCNRNNPEIYVHNGTGWISVNGVWSLPPMQDNTSRKEAFIDSSGQDAGLRLVDVNGDGLADLVRGKGSTKYTYINNGKDGWTYDSNWVMPLSGFVNGSNQDYGFRMADINGDNLPDALCHNDSTSGSCSRLNPEIRINTGNGWVDGGNIWSFPIKAYDAGKTEVFVDSSFQDAGLRVLDINGDGTDDLVKGQNASSKYSYTNNEDVQSNFLSNIAQPQGGSTAITYKATPLFRDGSNNLLNPSMPIISYVVSQTSTSDGIGSSIVNNYEYQNGEYYFNTYLNRKFTGFNKITKTDSANNKVVTFYHQGNSNDTFNGEYSDHISKIGRPYRIDVQDSSGNIYLRTVNKWDRYDLGSGRNFVKNVRTTELTYDGDSDHKDKTEEYIYDNTYGNLIQKVEWGEVIGSSDGSFTDTGTDKFTTDIAYATNIIQYIVSLPSQETKVDQNSNKVSENKYFYDIQALGNVTDGNLTKQEIWKTSSSYVDIEKTYNTTYGVVILEKDPRDKITSYSYDIYNLYPTTVTNALSQTVNYTYDYSSGLVKQITDANTRVHQNIYDGLDRIKEEKHPDLSNPSTLITKTSYTYIDTSGSVKVQRTDNLDGSTSFDTHTYYDGLNRPVQTRKETEDFNTYSVTDTIYNNTAQVYKESIPYFSTGSSKTSATTTTALLIIYAYDPLLRIDSVANAIGITSNVYDDWKLSTTDPRNKLKHIYMDSYKHLIKVEEINSGSTYTTNYDYDGNGNLKKISDTLGNIRNFTYDGLNRRLTAQDLHAVGDTTYGTWTYNYDDAGNLTSVIDPKDQTINYTYDDLNRKATEDYSGQAGIENTYIYDEGTDGKGRLTSVSSQGINTSYIYHPQGSLKQETKVIDGKSYTTSYLYDNQGNLIELTNPDDSKVKYTYNLVGLIETVQRKESTDTNYTNVVNDFDYGPHGKLTYQENANGSTTNNTYDSAKLYRLSGKVTTAAGSQVQNINYTYDPNGNVTQISQTDREAGPQIAVISSAATVSGTSPTISADVTTTGGANITSVQFYVDDIAYGAPDTTNPYSITWNTTTYTNGNHVLKAVATDSLNRTATSTNLNVVVDNSQQYNDVTVGNIFITFIHDMKRRNVVESCDGNNNFCPDVSILRKQMAVWMIKTKGEFNPPQPTQQIFYDVPLSMPEAPYIHRMYELGYTAGCGNVNGQPKYCPEDPVTRGQMAIFIERALGVTNPPDPGIQTFSDVPRDYLGVAPSVFYKFIEDLKNRGITNGCAVSPALKFCPDQNTTRAQMATFLYRAFPPAQIVSNPSSATWTNSTRSNIYTYDDLNRLVYASSTNPTTGLNYSQTYAYDAIGNLISKSDKGIYAYAGNQGSNYANPHAVTSIGSTNYSYDNNGNLLSDGTWGNLWDYQNRMIQSQKSGSVVSYAYDHEGQRVKLFSNSGITYYPSKNYNVKGGLATKHIFAGDQLVATITGSGAGAAVQTIHTDHLTGSNVVTNGSGAVVELMDYYPFGEARFDWKQGQFNEQRKFTGYEYDVDTGLNYAGARYYNPSIGRFMSQDPVFWNMSEIETQLADPQSWNSYSYARNNPLILTDPNGEFWHIVAGAAVGAAISGGITYWRTGDWNQAAKAAVGGAVAGALFAAVGPASLAGTVATGAVSSAAGNTLTRGLNGEQITAGTVAADVAAGAIGGAIGYGATKATQAVASKLAGPSIPKADSFQHINTAEKIVDDHALGKHVLSGKPNFGNIVTNRDESIGYVNSVLIGPNTTFRTPRGNIIYDKRLGGVIFDTKTRPSFFQPRLNPSMNGKQYFLKTVRDSIRQNLSR